MPEPTSEQRASYPLASYAFRVEIGTETWRFARISGLQREHHVATYRDGLSFILGEQLQRFHMDRYVSVTLEQGVVADQVSLYAWLAEGDPRELRIRLCDANGTPTLTWTVRQAVPVKLTAPSFDAKSNEVALDSLEIRASGITVQRL